MDQLTKFLVYNKTPKSQNSDYDAMKKEEKKETSAASNKRLLLLSPDLGRSTEGKWLETYKRKQCNWYLTLYKKLWCRLDARYLRRYLGHYTDFGTTFFNPRCKNYRLSYVWRICVYVCVCLSWLTRWNSG